MKKTSILIVFIGLAFVSCSKDEIAKSAKSDNTSFIINKESWHLTKKGIEIGGLICNELTNDVTGQSIYEPINENSSTKAPSTVEWEWSLRTVQGVASCSGDLKADCYCTPQGDIIHKPTPVPTN